MILGVGSLIVTMSVFSGFETALKNSIIDVVGHITLIKRGSDINSSEKVIEKLKKDIPQIKHSSPYVSLEAVAANKGKISGVRVEGVDSPTYENVLNIKSRVIKGKFNLAPTDDNLSAAMIGKGLAKTLNVDVGQDLKLIIPKPSTSNSRKFSPRSEKFRIIGIMDFGKYDYNERIVVIPMDAAQRLANIGEKIVGYRLRIDDATQVTKISNEILKNLGGYPYWTRTWYEVNQNLLDAIQIEKVVIFLVVLIMVVAACFNVASTLYVRVINRYSEISILKSMGAKKFFIVHIFALQGLVLGTIGATGGVLLGIILSRAFKWAEQRWSLIPADVYKIEIFTAELRYTDLTAVFVATFLVCFLSTLLPALRGARLNPTEGLRYE